MSKNITLQIPDELAAKLDKYREEYNETAIPVTRNAIIKRAIQVYIEKNSKLQLQPPVNN